MATQTKNTAATTRRSTGRPGAKPGAKPAAKAKPAAAKAKPVSAKAKPAKEQRPTAADQRAARAKRDAARAERVAARLTAADQVIAQLGTTGQSAIGAVRHFVGQVDHALLGQQEGASRGHEVIDSALQMSGQLVGTGSETIRGLLRTTGNVTR
jgi:membrane protein involved in colicin uptake